MSLERFSPLPIFFKKRRISIGSSLNVWLISVVKLSGPGLFFDDKLFITDFISLLIIVLFQFSVS
jgi:hypothetical protein